MVIVKVVEGEMLLVYIGRSARNNTNDCIPVDSAISSFNMSISHFTSHDVTDNSYPVSLACG
jgi:hypothetical protein